MRQYIAIIRRALESGPRTCRYHGTDWGPINPYTGDPRCETCWAPYRAAEALQALDNLEAALKEDRCDG